MFLQIFLLAFNIHVGGKGLNRLAALYIHKDIALNKEAVIDEFFRGNRRMKFVETEYR